MEKVKQLFHWATQQKPSYLAYLVAIIIYFIGLGSTLNKGYSYTELIAGSLFIFGVLFDSLTILKTLHNTLYEKFLYLAFAAITFFTYVQAEAFAKQDIYKTVHINPDLYNTSVAHIAGIYFIPSFVIILASFFVFAVLLSTLVISIFPVFDMFKKIKDYRKRSLHVAFYLIGFTVALTSAFTLDFESLQNKLLGKNYVISHLIAKDYYLNQSCKNIQSVYIKHLDDNLVSVTNITDFQYPLLWQSTVDHKVTFTLMECNQTIAINDHNKK